MVVARDLQKLSSRVHGEGGLGPFFPHETRGSSRVERQPPRLPRKDPALGLGDAGPRRCYGQRNRTS